AACRVPVAAGPAVERLGTHASRALVRLRRAGHAAGLRHAAGLGAARGFCRRRGLHASAVLQPDRGTGDPRRADRRAAAEPCAPSAVVRADAAAAAVPVHRLAARLGGAGRAAPAAGTGPALRTVLGAADLPGVLAGARQAAVLPATGTGRHDAAAVRRDRHAARTPAET